MQVDQLTIPVTDNVQLLVYSSSKAPLFEEMNAMEYCESRWQLQEGKEYDYEIIVNADDDASKWKIEDQYAIFSSNSRHPNMGKIKTGIYVGTVNFKAVRVDNNHTVFETNLSIEVQSVKADYRTDYRKMLTDITSYYTDLVMQQGSPVTQKFDVDYNTPQQTLYQKFAFVKSIIDNDAFEESVHKITSNPVRKWTEITAEKRIESVRRLSRNSMRQIAVRTDRTPVASGPMGLTSLPRTLSVTQKTDTVDTHENQFIKYVLTTFYAFCSGLSTKKNASNQLKVEVEVVCDKLASYLNSTFFKQVSRPTRLNIGSPVLQRKEGYREILQAWLMFDLAAKITWNGGETVYDAGKKNVAVLYEYWLFFKLMEVVSKVFKIDPQSKEKLVSKGTIDDRINLEIQQGKKTVINGKYDAGNRLLNVRLYYNRTFGFEEEIRNAGSWTMSMRPDYTLSIWPGDKTEAEAEKDDSIVHIHFDAKYRLNKILIDDKDVEDVESELKTEKQDREVDIYKRGDLLKMHAYKDAIRRTAGAYVLYPGTENKMRSGFHEIIPGLGAFCIAPGHEEDQLPALKGFLRDVVRHFMDRTSQREKVAVSNHKIYNILSGGFYENFPEPKDIEEFPDTIPVIVGYCKENNIRLKDVKKHYIIRLKGGEKEFVKMAEAKYLLLYDKGTCSVNLFKTIGDCTQIVTSENIKEFGYRIPTQGELYIIFRLSAKKVEKELQEREWGDISKVIQNGAPTLAKFDNLFPPKIQSGSSEI